MLKEKKITLLLLSMAWEPVGAPLSYCILLVDGWASEDPSERWATIATFAIPKSLWPNKGPVRSS